MSDTLDTRFMSRDFLTTFIHIYKQHPALWRIKSKEYANKNLKLKGYQALIQYCRSVYPSANRDFVTKKIQNMRGTFRKELRKIENYRKRRELYEPRLWYFDLLSFIKDQEFTDKSVECAGNASGEENSDGEKIEIVRQGSEDENAVSRNQLNRIKLIFSPFYFKDAMVKRFFFFQVFRKKNPLFGPLSFLIVYIVCAFCIVV